MAKFGKKYKPSRKAIQYARKIEVAWRSAFDSILEVAKLLNEALEDLVLAWPECRGLANSPTFVD